MSFQGGRSRSTPAAAPGGWEIGFNMRQTGGAIADVFPDVWFGSPNPVGWTLYDNGVTAAELRYFGPASSFNSPQADARIYGTHYRSSGAASRYQVRVPFGFSYQVRCATGHATLSGTGTQYRVFDADQDTVGVEQYAYFTGSISINQYVHITGVRGDPAQWATAYEAQFITITPQDQGADTMIEFEASTNDAWINHLRIRQI